MLTLEGVVKLEIDKQELTEHYVANENPTRQVLQFLGSMKLGIILILLLAILSLLATLRPMDVAIQVIYKSWWYIGIMALAALNLLLCTVSRVRPLWRTAFNYDFTLPPEKIKKLPVNRVIKLKNDGELSLESIQGIFKKNGLRPVSYKSGDINVIFGERGRLGYLGSVVTHISILIVLLAAVYGSATGFETRNGGLPGDKFYVPEGNFQVQIHSIERVYPSPTGSAEISDLSILRNGKEILRGLANINKPLRFEGISIYNSSCFWVSQLTLKDPNTGEFETIKLFEGDQFPLNKEGTEFSALAFFPDFSMKPNGEPYSKSSAPNRPVLAYRLVVDKQPQQWDLLELNSPTVLETASGPIEVEFSGYETALAYSISRNLGRPYLFIGSMLMLVGLYMSFFLFPRRFWAVIDARTSHIVIGGRGYRNRLGLEQVMERIESELTSTV